MFDSDATVEARRALREACHGSSTACEQGSSLRADHVCSEPSLPSGRVLWWCGGVIALRRRVLGRLS